MNQSINTYTQIYIQVYIYMYAEAADGLAHACA